PPNQPRACSNAMSASILQAAAAESEITTQPTATQLATCSSRGSSSARRAESPAHTAQKTRAEIHVRAPEVSTSISASRAPASDSTPAEMLLPSRKEKTEKPDPPM